MEIRKPFDRFICNAKFSIVYFSVAIPILILVRYKVPKQIFCFMISLELLINRTYIYLLLVVCIVLFKKTFEMKKDTYPHRRPTCSSHLTQPQPRRIHQWPSGGYPKWFWWWIACKIEVIILIRWYYDCYFGTRCYFCRLMIINIGGRTKV